MRHGLSDLKIRNLPKPARGQFEIWDTRLPGFGVRVSHGGTKSFVLVYRFQGRSRRMTLGRCGILGLADARQLALQALRAVLLGQDPGAEKLKARRIPPIQQFDRFVDHFLASYARLKNKTAGESERLLRREFVTCWRNRPIAGISKHDVLQVLDRLVAQGNHTTANRAFGALRRLFNWAIERGLIEQSPCAGLRMPTKEIPRDRVLRDAELNAVWHSLEAIGYAYGPFAQLLLLTGQRKGEVAGLRWQEIDFAQRLWTLPAPRNKSGRAHVLPLTDKVIEILTGLPRLHPELVFPARTRRGQSMIFRGGKKNSTSRSAVTGWRLHDLRRTAATGMARAGVAPHVVERVLNHSKGIVSGVAAVYNRFGYLPEMRAALEAWERHVLDVINFGRNRPSATNPIEPMSFR